MSRCLYNPHINNDVMTFKSHINVDEMSRYLNITLMLMQHNVPTGLVNQQRKSVDKMYFLEFPTLK